MTVHKLTAGDGYTYLTRQVAANDATDRGFESLGDYYSAKGEAPGVWIGSGLANVPDFDPTAGVTEAQMASLFGEGRHPNAAQLDELVPPDPRQSQLGAPYRTFDEPNEFRRRTAGAYRDYNLALGLPVDTSVPAEDRARIRGELARDMFTAEYDRPPADARELSGHLARISRQRTTAVAGYDLTFSPVKSVSTLWAIAPRDIAQIIELAHHDAVKDTISWLEANAAYTRRGKNGVRQVDVHGVLAAAFAHRDSRAGDPDLHTHVAVSNKVQTIDDGAWLALDGRPMFKNGVAASERYNTRLEALLSDRLGLRFAARAGDDPQKRPVREIVGVDGELPRRWSARRAAIDARRSQLSASFQHDHGRPPSPTEAIALAQQANLETRQAKHEARSYAEQREAWRNEAIAVLGDENGLARYIAGAVPRRREARTPTRPTPDWVREAADTVVTAVQRGRATWQVNHVRAEAERYAREADIGLEYLNSAVEAVVTAALHPDRSVSLANQHDVITGPIPGPLMRRDGSSVYSVAGSALYTSREVLAAEHAIVASAGRQGGRCANPADVDAALSKTASTGQALNRDQEQLVRELATSGLRVQLALAPAGTGKTTAMRALADAWTRSGGRVVGLAPSAAAAAVLRDELEHSGTHADTLAKFVHSIAMSHAVPGGVSTIGPDTLVVIDEAGMAGTVELADAIAYVIRRGGSIRLVGDDRQLAAVAAGGVLRDIATTHGAVTLNHVVRYIDPDTGAANHAEGAASLALRDGDPAAIAFYTDNGRVHVGDRGTATDGAYTAWANDHAAGRDAVMLAPTRDLVADLNARARRDRLEAATEPTGREVQLADGARASAGDAIITRENNRRLLVTSIDWVKNGDRWTVKAVDGSGGLDVIHLRSGRRMQLPADYVAKNVSLGYATTVHGAQGITADTSYTIASGSESRQLLYVALTRGRHANHVFLATAGDGDIHAAITRDALLPPTAVDILTRILARDGSPQSATSAKRAARDPAAQLGHVADQYSDTLSIAVQARLGPARMKDIDAAADNTVPGITASHHYPALQFQLAYRAVLGHSPMDVLRVALDAGGLADARDVAATLTWRVASTSQNPAGLGPLPWLPALPSPLRDDADWGQYLSHHVDTIVRLADQVAEAARGWTASDAPAWAVPFLSRGRRYTELLADLAVWRAAQHVEMDDRQPTGQPLSAAADVRAQGRLDRRVENTLQAKPVENGWPELATGLDPRILTDPYWPTLQQRLIAAGHRAKHVAALVKEQAVVRPLPDEQPAAALWWRLAQCLPRAATIAPRSTPQPPWVPILAEVVGETTVRHMQADANWPDLVDAIAHAGRDFRSPAQLLTTARGLASRNSELTTHVPDLTCSLLCHVEALADTRPPDSDEFLDGEPEPAEFCPQASSVNIADPPCTDEEWARSLVEQEKTVSPPTAPSAGRVSMRYSSANPERTDTADALQQSSRVRPTEGVDRDRLLDLNRQAAEFFAARLSASWVPNYLTVRFGLGPARRLLTEQQLLIGYAPGGWADLTTHLHHYGASDEEIVTSGLGAYASTGRVIDRFRDRLVVPVQAMGSDGQLEVRGWLGRRNPSATGAEAGPKYLNTAETLLFAKRNELYGLAEHRDILLSGAVPVLVEGPMDALAVTVASDGRYVGIGVMGSGLSDAQADLLRPYVGYGRSPAVIATDSDVSGRRAAHHAFWQLALLGDDPRNFDNRGCKDPSEFLGRHGADELVRALRCAGPLAETVMADRAESFGLDLSTVEGAVRSARAAAQVIVALPPETWPARLTQVACATGVAEQTAYQELLAAHTSWSTNPTATARAHEREYTIRVSNRDEEVPKRLTFALQGKDSALCAEAAPRSISDGTPFTQDRLVFHR